MLHKTKGFVLKTTRFKETSLIVKVFTEAFGIKTYIVKGVKGKGSKFPAGLFNPLSQLHMVVYDNGKDGIQNVKELRLQNPNNSFSSNIYKSSIILFINEVLIQVLKEEEHNPKLYNFLDSSINLLDLLEEDFVNFHLVFLVQLSKYLGFYPTNEKEQLYFDLQEGEFSNVKPIHPYILENQELSLFKSLLGTGFEHLSKLEISNKDRRSLLNQILLYYKLHLNHFKTIKSHEVLETVMA